jgi:choline dehydrogenase
MPRGRPDERPATLAGDIAGTVFHPPSITRMGRDDVRWRGARCALRVADAGALPPIASANTHSPTLMVADGAAEWIVADARRTG